MWIQKHGLNLRGLSNPDRPSKNLHKISFALKDEGAIAQNLTGYPETDRDSTITCKV
jgi:hypothetical protein